MSKSPELGRFRAEIRLIQAKMQGLTALMLAQSRSEHRPRLSAVIPMLDPSDSMDNFLHRMKFLKTKGFQPVERILPSDVSSS